MGKARLLTVAGLPFKYATMNAMSRNVTAQIKA
jgi:hypothetical protein